MRRYAEKTGVTPEATLGQIKKTVMAAGAQAFATQEEEDFAQIAFRMHGRVIRFRVEYPSKNDREFTHTAVQGWRREPAKAEEMWQQAIRQRWRALLLVIKAKLEAVKSGVVSWEDEFLSYTLLRTGQTVAEWIVTQERLQALMGADAIDVEALPAPEVE